MDAPDSRNREWIMVLSSATARVRDLVIFTEGDSGGKVLLKIASTVATKIRIRQASEGLPRGRYSRTLMRGMYRFQDNGGG